MKYLLLPSINSPADVRKLSRLELKQLATELRDYVLTSISQTGGHLSSNLGTVELTIALHHVFDTPNDRLVWDVGHQTYPHKVLTGRRERMSTLRQLGGISGFQRGGDRGRRMRCAEGVVLDLRRAGHGHRRDPEG